MTYGRNYNASLQTLSAKCPWQNDMPVIDSLRRETRTNTLQTAINGETN